MSTYYRLLNQDFLIIEVMKSLKTCTNWEFSRLSTRAIFLLLLPFIGSTGFIENTEVRLVPWSFQLYLEAVKSSYVLPLVGRNLLWGTKGYEIIQKQNKSCCDGLKLQAAVKLTINYCIFSFFPDWASACFTKYCCRHVWSGITVDWPANRHGESDLGKLIFSTTHWEY